MFKDWPKWIGMDCVTSKWQWLAEGEEFSIISPSKSTFESYELFDGEDIYRFATFKEAKQKAEELKTPISPAKGITKM